MSSSNETKFAFLSENKGLGDLRSKSNIELKELLERQDHLLSNKFLINKLNDKGEKIRKVRSELAQELDSRTVKNNATIKKSVKNSTAIEWRDSNVSRNSSGQTIENSDIEKETDTIKILSENGQVPKHDHTKSHITRLLEKETDPEFSFKPYNSVVALKIKNVVPDAHTTACSSLVKTIHLVESLNILSQQMSALKILGTRSKRVEECIEDRINESIEDHEQDDEVTDELETKVGLGISVNVDV